MVNDISNFQTKIRGNAADVARRELAKREAAPAKPRKQPRAEENYIPGPESLSTLIRNALATLKEGLVFDRGSIVNLVV